MAVREEDREGEGEEGRRQERGGREERDEEKKAERNSGWPGRPRASEVYRV